MANIELCQSKQLRCRPALELLLKVMGGEMLGILTYVETKYTIQLHEDDKLSTICVQF